MDALTAMVKNNPVLQAISLHVELIEQANAEFNTSRKENIVAKAKFDEAGKIARQGIYKGNHADALMRKAVTEAFDTPEAKAVLKMFSEHPGTKAACDAWKEEEIAKAVEKISGESLVEKAAASELQQQSIGVRAIADEALANADAAAERGRKLFEKANELAEKHNLTTNKKK